MNTDLSNAINLIKECNTSKSISKDKSIAIINSLVNYIKIDPFDILYEIYKVYEVEEKEKPFINREYYKHTFRTDEDVEIGFYVDDNSESFYKNNVISYYKMTFWNDFNLITSKTYESGSHVINLGKMSPGEHVISKGDIFMWSRCQNYTIRDNKLKKINEGESDIGTHHVRVYNNECSDTIACYRSIARNCKCTSFSGKGDKMDLTVINSEYPKVTTTNSVYHIIEQKQVIKYINAKDSKFLIEGAGLTTTIFQFSILDCDNRNFENCSFNGGKYILQSASGQFNTGKFTNCKFDKIRIEPSVTEQTTLTNASIVFKNCFLPIDGELLFIGPFASSRGKINITFENCVIVDSGIQQSDNYHTRTNLIYALGKPSSGTITFKNCIIKKTDGGLLSGYGGTASDFKVEIIFEKTGVSSNLTVDSTYTSNATITKK